jgi:cholera toxin transcriptional activator
VALEFSTAKQPDIIRFGAFEVDLQARELRRSGRRLKLQEQPFAVLSLLLERAGNIVSREELRQRLWPADTFVDFDHSLNTAVNKLREVLGDSAGTPRFIETVARRGYRFIAVLERQEFIDETPRSASILANPSHDLPRANRRLTRALFLLIQVMYLIFYIESLVHWEGVYNIGWPHITLPVVFVVALVTSLAGIPLRLYLISAAAFDYSRLGENFQTIFPAVLLLDQLWAIAPFLVIGRIGFGATLGATAALLYVPFAERTLMRMAYRQQN